MKNETRFVALRVKRPVWERFEKEMRRQERSGFPTTISRALHSVITKGLDAIAAERRGAA